MAVFLALVLGSAAARVGLALMFAMTGVAYFVPTMRRDMIAIVPPALPAPALLVTVTGVLEVLGAAACCSARPASPPCGCSC